MEFRTITFTQGDTFEALEAAQKWLRENGYSYGSLQREAPVGIKKGDYIIDKWRHLSNAHVAGLDGVMEGNFRDGPVTIRLKPGSAGDQYDH